MVEFLDEDTLARERYGVAIVILLLVALVAGLVAAGLGHLTTPLVDALRQVPA